MNLISFQGLVVTQVGFKSIIWMFTWVHAINNEADESSINLMNPSCLYISQLSEHHPNSYLGAEPMCSKTELHTGGPAVLFLPSDRFLLCHSDWCLPNLTFQVLGRTLACVSAPDFAQVLYNYVILPL